MNNFRIIPRMDIKNNALVKGVHMEGLRVLGDPVIYAEKYYSEGADELFFVDVVASLYQRNSLYDLVEKLSKKIFIPLTVAGGIRSHKDVLNMLAVGADKVCLNTAAINNPNLIKQLSNEFGKSTIVIAIEAIKQGDGEYYCFTDNGREPTGIKCEEWIKKIEQLGAGEIILTSVDRDGTSLGFNEELMNLVPKNYSINTIGHGGCGQLEQLSNLIKTNINAVCIASCLHYNYAEELKNKSNNIQGNTHFLTNIRQKKHLKPFSIDECKKYLIDNKVTTILHT
jgi:imidazole glycerol-phosphate synthase subunit HisF